MLNITVIDEGAERVLSVPFDSHKSLLDILRDAGYPLDAPCGGNGICQKCTVFVDGRAELSCTFVPEKDVTVSIATRKEDVVKNAVDIGALPDVGVDLGLGMALDIGTTTVAAFLYDLGSGKCLAATGARNAQGRFGADVISRIRYAENDAKMLQLCSLIREQVYDLGLELCEKASGKDGTYGMQDIRYVSVAGNTVMQSLFAAISPKPIGEAPFQPISLFGEEIVAEPTMYFCPCISGYVGGDTTAGLLSTGLYKAEKTSLLADLGTNCEFALGDRNGFLCASAPAGPAFGRGLAREKLYASEFIKLAAQFLSEGVIDETGRFYPEVYREKHADDLERAEKELKTGSVSKEEPTPEASASFAEQYMSRLATEIRSLQLARAAVRGAVETILSESGISAKDVDRIYVAGGFGAHLDPEDAIALGLFPKAFAGKLQFVGNTAGEGASLALREENRKLLSKIAGMCRYEELSTSRTFNEKYIEAMCFGDGDEEDDDDDE